MRTFFRYVSLLAVFLYVGCATAQQQYSTKNRKAIKLFEEAMVAPQSGIDKQTGGPDYRTGIALLEKAIGRDENFLEAHQLIGEFFRVTGNTKKSVYHFKRSLDISPHSNLGGVLYYDIAEQLMRMGEYEEAIQYFERVLRGNNPGITKELFEAAQRHYKNATFAIEAKRNPLKIEPKNIGPGINTEHPEYFPTLTVDGRTMLFTRELPHPKYHPRGQEDFFISHLSEKNIWMKATPMPSYINTDRNEGGPTLSADGRTLIFVACAEDDGDYGPGRQGYGSCDLFITKKIGGEWTHPINLPGEVNTATWESQPSLSSDGKTLYFIRRVRQYGTPRSDIFVSKLKPNGTWGKAVPLPNNVNTMREETSVHIHPDGRTLYFASNGHVGLGGFDIYMTQLQPDGSWSNPVNLGYPINTENNENSLLVGPDGDVAFFASDREGGYGHLDIYYFELPVEFRPTPTTYFEGVVFDATNKKPLGANFELIDLETQKVVIRSEADKMTGEFMVALPINKKYALNVNYPEYAFFSKNFDMKTTEDYAPVQMDVPLIPSGSKGAVTLENVFFDLAKSTLRPESYVELNRLVDFLNDNKSVRIEIAGHTDTRGNADANMTLSENRAEAVYNYLVSKGIDESRLSFKGYGQTQPKHSDEAIAKLPTEAAKEQAHQENRRTEYRILN